MYYMLFNGAVAGFQGLVHTAYDIGGPADEGFVGSGMRSFRLWALSCWGFGVQDSVAWGLQV